VDGKAIGSGGDGVVSQLTFPPGASVPAYVGRYVSDGKTSFALSFGGEAGREYDSIWMGDGGKLFVQENGSIEYFARSGELLYRAAAKAE